MSAPRPLNAPRGKCDDDDDSDEDLVNQWKIPRETSLASPAINSEVSGVRGS